MPASRRWATDSAGDVAARKHDATPPQRQQAGKRQAELGLTVASTGDTHDRAATELKADPCRRSTPSTPTLRSSTVSAEAAVAVRRVEGPPRG